jgi:hypothetical protein
MGKATTQLGLLLGGVGGGNWAGVGSARDKREKNSWPAENLGR